VDHAWNTHMYREECHLLAKCLNQTPGVEAVVSPDLDWPADPMLLKGVKAVVFYSRPADDILFAPERRRQTAGLFQSGVGYAAVHWGTGVRKKEHLADYRDLLGGAWQYGKDKLSVGTYRLEQVSPDSPVCRGWLPYDLRDEIYLEPAIHPKATPVLKVSVRDKDHVVAWTHDRTNGGRSFGTTLGHFHDNFRTEAFRRMVVNGILWSARVEVPAGGAPVAVTDDDLKLPPAPPKSTPAEKK
jgi:type 1 glutamine amidotransferase